MSIKGRGCQLREVRMHNIALSWMASSCTEFQLSVLLGLSKIRNFKFCINDRRKEGVSVTLGLTGIISHCDRCKECV